MPLSSSSLYCTTTTLLITTLLIIFFLFLGNNYNVSAAKPQLISPTSKDEQSSPDRQVLVDVAGYGEHKISTVLVTGSVLCDLNTHGGRVTSQPVPGAVVALNCNISRKIRRRSFGRIIKGVTDDYGDFTIDLPSHLHAIPNLHNKCFIKLLHLPNNFSCHCAYKPASSSNKHQQKGMSMFLAATNDDGLRTYSVGTIRLHHPRA